MPALTDDCDLEYIITSLGSVLFICTVSDWVGVHRDL